MSTNDTNNPQLAVAVLTSCGAIGPLLSLVEVRLFVDHWQLYSVLYDIVLLLWPFQILEPLGHSLGPATTLAVLLSANLALYWSLAQVVLMRPRRLPKILATIPLACCWLPIWVIIVATDITTHKNFAPPPVAALYLVGACYLCKRIAGPRRASEP
jgi:hypothetical protein